MSFSLPHLSQLRSIHNTESAGAQDRQWANPSPAGPGAFNGRATANVKFTEPGDYVLHVTANDYSGDGGGGFGCCWTTALVKVAVKP